MAASARVKAARTPALQDSEYVAAPLCIPHIFSAAECDAIFALGAGRMRYQTSLSNPIEGYRSALTLWIDRGTRTAWLEERLSQVAARVNALYGFDIAGFHESFLLSEYRRGDGFKWHLDVNEACTSTRKLSFSVQLSDDGDYEGGRLQFMPMGEVAFSRSRGSVIVFPSYLCHRVTRVTRGARRALIAWAHGNTFS